MGDAANSLQDEDFRADDHADGRRARFRAIFDKCTFASKKDLQDAIHTRISEATYANSETESRLADALLTFIPFAYSRSSINDPELVKPLTDLLRSKRRSYDSFAELLKDAHFHLRVLFAQRCLSANGLGIGNGGGNNAPDPNGDFADTLETQVFRLKTPGGFYAVSGLVVWRVLEWLKTYAWDLNQKGPVCLFLVGPTGAGKSTLAEIIHQWLSNEVIRHNDRDPFLSKYHSGDYTGYDAKDFVVALAGSVERQVSAPRQNQDLGEGQRGKNAGSGEKVGGKETKGIIELFPSAFLFFDEVGNYDSTVLQRLRLLIDNGQMTKLWGDHKRVTFRGLLCFATNEEFFSSEAFPRDVQRRLSKSIIRLPSACRQATNSPEMTETVMTYFSRHPVFRDGEISLDRFPFASLIDGTAKAMSLMFGGGKPTPDAQAIVNRFLEGVGIGWYLQLIYGLVATVGDACRATGGIPPKHLDFTNLACHAIRTQEMGSLPSKDHKSVIDFVDIFFGNIVEAFEAQTKADNGDGKAGYKRALYQSPIDTAIGAELAKPGAQAAVVALFGKLNAIVEQKYPTIGSKSRQNALNSLRDLRAFLDGLVQGPKDPPPE